jgi:outer membrane protein TolC
MKRVFLFTVVVLLFAAHLVAQSEVDQDYIDLLKKRVEVAQKKFDWVDAGHKIGAKNMTAWLRAESRIALATSETALYRQTGERENLLAALERRREAANDLVQAVQASYKMGTIPLTQLADAELALAEAEYELKKAKREPVHVQGKTVEQWQELFHYCVTKGYKSENESIRTTSQQVIDALTKLAELENSEK